MPFEFGEMFRSLLGLNPRPTDPPPDNRWSPPSDSDRDHYNERSDDERHRRRGPEDMFDLFNESMQMHQYIEKQFGDMLRMFDAFGGGGGGSSFFEGGSPFEDFGRAPALPAPERSIRDEYLKPGYDRRLPRGGGGGFKDSDLDGVIEPGDVDRLIRRDDGEDRIVSSEPFSSRSPNFFGRVVITQTITKPDGTIETRKTVRDSRNDTEETTVTVRHRDDNRDLDVYPPPNDAFDWSKFFKH